MITKVGTVSVFVEDQQRAKSFYTETLGFELRTDAPLYPGSETRWIEVAPSGAETVVVLYEVDDSWEHYRGVIGRAQALTLAVDDLARTHEALVARGASFDGEPHDEPWGRWATLIDSEGNRILLVQSAD